MNDLFISMQYNNREFEGISEFKNELDNNYNYQLKPHYIPAASEGAEFWMTIFINSEVTKFLAAAIAGGFIWDLIKVGTKKYVFKPLFKALEELNEKNEPVWGRLRILKLKFQFDDCEIFIGGLNKNFISVISTVFNEVSKKKPRFEREVGQGVIMIELPIKMDEREEIDREHKYWIDVFNEDYSIEAFKKLWKITFSTNFPVMIYDFGKDELFDI